MAQGAEVDFARDIRPVLSDACYHCHGPDAKVRKAKLRLHDREATLEAGVLTDGRRQAGSGQVLAASAPRTDSASVGRSRDWLGWRASCCASA